MCPRCKTSGCGLRNYIFHGKPMLVRDCVAKQDGLKRAEAVEAHQFTADALRPK